jgi:hypothetical protein
LADVGASASQTITAIGQRVTDPLREVDLAIDAEGDLYDMDPAGDHEIIQPAVTWPGATASEAV